MRFNWEAVLLAVYRSEQPWTAGLVLTQQLYQQHIQHQQSFCNRIVDMHMALLSEHQEDA